MSDGHATGVLPEFDSSLRLLLDGYEFISNRCRRQGTDIFETRLVLRPAICISGAEAAHVFYDDDRLTRRRALPITALTLLQDKGSVSLLDGTAHRHRKRLFLEMLGPGRFDGLLAAARAEWHAAAERWQRRAGVRLHEASQDILCRAVCTWAGVPLAELEVPRRTRELGAMVDGAGAFGPRQLRGQVLRQRTESWLRRIVGGIRRGDVAVPEGSAAHMIAWHRQLDGSLLDTRVVAVELLNVIRPTVAVARYITFAALALHHHPDAAERVRAGGPQEAEQFVHEVRRLYPFFPLIGGRVVKPFEWRGHVFPRDRWVLLDVFGTNRDPRAWEAPEEFRPERFRDWEGDPFALIPQGGGDHRANHRCAGEWVTIALMRLAVEQLASAIDYDVPAQDLTMRLTRIPAIPRSGFVIADVRPRR